jgi:hypothetical protein
MAEQPLYIRIRGRVSGPFSLHQLKALRDRGQFRRFHEISPDRQRWSSAASLTDLFAPETAGATGTPLTFPELEEPVLAKVAKENGAKMPSALAAWHYVDARGNPQGPVPQDHLLNLWQQGKLSPETLVWRDGLTDWLEITAPQTGLGLVARRSPLGLPLGVWIGIIAAVAGVALAILGYAVYKWGETNADNVGVWPENYQVRRLFYVAWHDGRKHVSGGGERTRPAGREWGRKAVSGR